jgi:hypothetical protein
MYVSENLLTLDKDDLENQLQMDLEGELDELPLEDACEYGGFPDPVSVSVYDVERVFADEEELAATFSVSFTECRNTGCGDCVVEHQHNMDCRMTIDRKTCEATIQSIEPEYIDEF